MLYKGLVVIAIAIAVVVAAILVAFSVGLFRPSEMREEGTGAEVPTYSGSSEYSLADFYYQRLGIPRSSSLRIRVYFVEGATASQVLEWYRSRLSDYEIVEEHGVFNMTTPEGVVEWGAILFKKGNEGVGIWALSGAPISDNGKTGTAYCIVTGDIGELMGGITTTTSPTTTPSGLPPSDLVSGEEPLPRYPGSVMITYTKSEGFPLIIIIEYGTNAGMSAVANWYKSELSSRGWELREERSSTEKISLQFVKQREEVGVIIYAPTSEVSYTSISVHYGSYELPSSDIASGEEPISRYPGSVMLKHSSMVVGGVKVISINYGTYDDAAAVASWYKDYLKNSGWTFASEQREADKYILFFYKGNAAIQLTITAKAYTDIEVLYQSQ